jgi:hypothetical protein
MPTEQVLHDFYSQYDNVRASKKVSRHNAIKNLESIIDSFSISKKSNILDFGSGKDNQFVEICKYMGFKNSFGYDKFINDKVWNNKKWDLITLWGVLEHLVDPIETLLQLRKTLNKDGMIILTTVSTESIIPFQYKPPEHTLYFTDKAIRYLADSVGLYTRLIKDYEMIQNSDVYFNILLRLVPDKLKKKCSHKMPKFIKVPTNEIYVVMGV